MLLCYLVSKLGGTSNVKSERHDIIFKINYTFRRCLDLLYIVLRRGVSVKYKVTFINVIYFRNVIFFYPFIDRWCRRNK